MSITTSIPSASAVVNAIKSITTDWKTEEKDVEEESAVVLKQVIPSSDNDGDYDPKEDEEQGVADEEADSEYLCELEETESVSDDDYDPNDDKEQGIKDGEEDLLESQESECTEKSDDIFAELENEEKLVNSDEFAKEFDSAINNVLFIAKIEREKILTNAAATYKEFTGEEATDDIIADAFKVFSIDCEIETETDEQYIDVDPDEYRAEFEEALDNVRAVAKVDQQRLYDTICDIKYDFYGTEPDAKQISQIFGRIKEEFAEEARQEFLDLNEVIDDEEDEDYDLNKDDADYSQDSETDDQEQDKEEEEEEEEEEDDDDQDDDDDDDDEEENENTIDID